MKIPVNAIIPDEKFTRYLLTKRDFDDKSQFLNNAGYTIENYTTLIADIRVLVQENEAIEDRTDEYGTFYRAKGILHHSKQFSVCVTTIWLHKKVDGSFQFITLIPERRG